MVVFQDELWVGGNFEYVGSLSRIASQYVSKWTGSNWVGAAFTTGSTGVRALKVFQDRLYAGIQGRLIVWGGSSWISVSLSSRPYATGLNKYFLKI